MEKALGWRTLGEVPEMRKTWLLNAENFPTGDPVWTAVWCRTRQTKTHRPNPGPDLVVLVKFHRNAALLICVHIVYSCFHTKRSELNSYYGL